MRDTLDKINTINGDECGATLWVNAGGPERIQVKLVIDRFGRVEGEKILTGDTLNRQAFKVRGWC